MAVSVQILPNNIVLITEPVASARSAAIGFWFAVGSRYESKGYCGITHFVEHMLFKGTANRSAFDIACAFDRMGGYANAFTERENVCVYCTAPAAHAVSALDIMCDMAENAVFNHIDIEKERSVIQNEIETALDDAEESGLDVSNETVWPSSRLGGSIAGSSSDVASITEEQLRSWYARYFAEGMLTVFAAGGGDMSGIYGRLRGMRRHAAAAEPVFKKQIWQPGCTFISAPFRQEQFFILFPVPYPVSERRYFAYAVLNALIGDTMSSRLFQRLREKDGLCYTVYSFFSFYTGAGSWCAYVSSSRRNCRKVMEGALDELEKLATLAGENGSQLPADEVDAAKEHLCGEEIISSEETEYLMRRLQRCWSFGFPFRTTEETVAMIRDISAEELADAARSLLDMKKMAALVYGAPPAVSVQDKIQNSIKSRMR